MPKKKTKLKPKELRQYTVEFSITGRAYATIEAASEEEAREIANTFEVEATLTEWEFDEVGRVTLDE